MNVRKAMDETIELAKSRGMEHCVLPDDPWMTWEHLLFMQSTMHLHLLMETDKMNRWLGWAQCAVVAARVATSAEVAEINRRNSSDRDQGN